MTAIHAKVMTPCGPGLYQGRTEDGTVFVSHRPQDLDKAARERWGWRGGPWVLAEYKAEQVKESPG